MTEQQIVRRASETDGRFIGWMIFCPGCQCGHLFREKMDNGSPGWSFNGDEQRPTFNPSMLVHANPLKGDEIPGYKPQGRCHSFIRDGQIQFLADCDHSLAGQTVPLEPF